MGTNIQLAALFTMLACACQAQELSSKITFSEPAGTADHVLADLAKAGGIHLGANADMSREVILISVTDQQLSTVLKKVATVTSGKWKLEDGAYTLMPDLDKRAEEETNDKALTVKEIKKAQDKVAARLAKARQPAPKGSPAKGDADDLLANFSPFGGPNTLVDEYFCQLDPAALASVGHGERIVFASSPNGLQFPLPEIPTEDLSTFVEKHNASVAAIKSKAGKQQTQEGSDFNPFGLADMFAPIVGTPAKIDLSVNFPPFQMTPQKDFSGKLIFYDATGKAIFSQNLLSLTDSMFQSAVSASESTSTNSQDGKPMPSTQQASATLAAKIQFSSESKELAGSGAMAFLMPGAKPLSKELKEKLLSPDRYDILSFIPSEFLNGLAKQNGFQIVADLPDSTFAMHDLSKLKPTFEALQEMGTEGGYACAKSDAWVTIAPADPARSRENRFNRKATAALIASCKGKLAVSLDDMAAYALATDEPDVQGPVGIYLALVPGSIMKMAMGSDWPSLRFYGSLMPDQRNTLGSGGFLPLNALTPDQVDLVKTMVYGSGTSLKTGKPETAKQPDLFDLANLAGMFGTSGKEDYRTEPTEALPNGLPAGFVIRAAVSKATAVADVGDGFMGSEMMGLIDANYYGLMKTITSSPALAAAGSMPQFASFKVGSKTTFAFTFQLLPGLYFTKLLTDDFVATDAATITADQLPDDFKASVSKYGEELKKKGIFGMFGNQTPPAAPPN